MFSTAGDLRSKENFEPSDTSSFLIDDSINRSNCISFSKLVASQGTLTMIFPGLNKCHKLNLPSPLSLTIIAALYKRVRGGVLKKNSKFYQKRLINNLNHKIFDFVYLQMLIEIN
ncbi:hypothetical protein BpHYR1_021475 [Brachionus plicatilis]|uniref:Uncharacterized protein n=1 Tax=Brachionus plicatilis TaxID=10195 RepID=A0A3M7R7N5_BRAPC|nr:hypothetical protein BpHYR1_021475 [Brachionus plicatilis]